MPLVGVAAAVVLVVAGSGIGYALSRGNDSKPTPAAAATGSASSAVPGATTPSSTGTSPAAGTNTTAPGPVSLTQQRVLLSAWAGSDLSRTAVIVADPQTAAILGTAGFTNVKSDDQLAGLDTQNVDYLVSVPGDDTKSAERDRLAEASAPLAVFSSGAQAITLAQVFPGGAGDLKARQAASLAGRQAAAKEVPANPAIQFLGATKAVVAGGGVDLRAMTVLVVLAQNNTVFVRAISVDPAEARAGQPARTLTITVGDSQAAQTVLSALPILYRPQTVTMVSPGTLTLAWMPAVAPVVADG